MVCVELPLLVRIYLTSTNVDNRSSGTRLLSEVLTQIDPNCLNSDEGWCMLRYNLSPSLMLSIHPPLIKSTTLLHSTVIVWRTKPLLSLMYSLESMHWSDLFISDMNTTWTYVVVFFVRLCVCRWPSTLCQMLMWWLCVGPSSKRSITRWVYLASSIKSISVLYPWSWCLQSQQFPQRRLVYAIMDHFLSNHLQGMMSRAILLTVIDIWLHVMWHSCSADV